MEAVAAVVYGRRLAGGLVELVPVDRRDRGHHDHQGVKATLIQGHTAGGQRTSAAGALDTHQAIKPLVVGTGAMAVGKAPQTSDWTSASLPSTGCACDSARSVQALTSSNVPTPAHPLT